MIIAALLLFVATAFGVNIPAVPQNEAHVNAFIAKHGRPLLEDFARASLATKTGRPAHTISNRTVASTTASMFTRLHTKSDAEKVQYLTGMQKKVEILKAGWK